VPSLDAFRVVPLSEEWYARGYAGLPGASSRVLSALLAPYLMAMGFTGDRTALVMGSGGAPQKNSYTWSFAQSEATVLPDAKGINLVAPEHTVIFLMTYSAHVRHC
jgi:hypothetical protein